MLLGIIEQLDHQLTDVMVQEVVLES